MNALRNPIVYIVAYIVLMVPTYILPYFGSNSFLINVGSSALVSSFGPTPQWWIHVWFLVALITLAWARTEFCTKKWLPIFPVVAALFDMTPVISNIPLVPTVMHVCAMIFGVTLASENASTIQPSLRKPRMLLVIWTIVTVIAISLRVATFAALADKTKGPSATPFSTGTAAPSFKPVDPAPRPVEPSSVPAAPPSATTQSASTPIDAQSKDMLKKANKSLDALLK